MTDDLATCVQCGLCLSACPTYRLTGVEGYSPRGRIAAIRGLEGGGPVTALTTDFLDTCLGCRACEAACPSGVPYGRILEHAREARPPRGGIADAVLLWAMARRWRLSVLSLVLYVPQKLGLLRFGGPLRGVPKLKLRTLLVRMATNYAPSTEERGQVVLFTGCVQDAWARDVHWATIAVLTRLGYRVRQPHGQVCCGALHAHAGRTHAADKLAAANEGPLTRYEGEIVVNSAGCGAKLKEYEDLAIAARIRDVSEVIDPDDLRALAPKPPSGLQRVAVHDPCHLNFVQRIHGQPRELLRAAGYDVVDVPDGGRCCGAAGSYAMHHPEWAVPLREQKLDACRSVAPDAVAVANPGCLFWMASGPGAPRMYHPIQLVAMALVNASRERRS
jgi:glycolate oxidase iron-sulfur subunit